MLKNYEKPPRECPPWVEITHLSALGEILRFPFFPSWPTTIFTYLPSTSGSCLDSFRQRRASLLVFHTAMILINVCVLCLAFCIYPLFTLWKSLYIIEAADRWKRWEDETHGRGGKIQGSRISAETESRTEAGNFKKLHMHTVHDTRNFTKSDKFCEKFCMNSVQIL